MDRDILVQYIESRLKTIQSTKIMKLMNLIESDWQLNLEYDSMTNVYYINTFNLTLQQLAELKRVISE